MPHPDTHCPGEAPIRLASQPGTDTPLLRGRIASPIGEILLVFDQADQLRALDFHDYEHRMHTLLHRHYGRVTLTEAPVPACIADPLARYFRGDHAALDTISVHTQGTPFQRDIWSGLRRIQPGTTQSYAALAASIGRPAACRAAGAANGANPVAIVVPCHRVIGASGALTGFGGGLHRKQWLLAHERAGRTPR